MYKSDAVGYAIFGGTILFMLGGALGTLTMKWACDEELRSLRAQNHTLAGDGRACCDAAFVAMKFRGALDKDACEQLQTPSAR